MTPAADVTEAPSPTAGRWTMTTETATYLLDLDTMTAQRLPEGGAGSIDGTDVHTATLRRDGDTLSLLEIPTIAVGERCLLLLDVRQDGVATRRFTTFVRALAPRD